MFIEQLDLLRCVNAHEDTWLVASFRTVKNRFVEEATLGCPRCSAKYEIAGGTPDFTLGESVPLCEEERAAASHLREELATRAGAYLDATRPGTTIVLGGLWAYAAQELADLADVRVIALNAPSTVKESERVGLVRMGTQIPLAPNSVHGLALDAWFPTAIIDAATRVVRPHGRIVGPAGFTSPPDSIVLARDEKYWIAEKPGEMISIQRSANK
ncbi:MAG TPA: hypothetical protein VM053_08005 [Gemmatimonadaceae bacterium]|nr:hypothetical protein [Gemmatimonadaceae bacterium]